MINLNILNTFVAVVDHGSVIGASRVCGYSPAAVSRQMAGLQRRLGVRLFEADGRGIRSTAAAEDLAVEARRLLDESYRFDAHARAVALSTHRDRILHAIPT